MKKWFRSRGQPPQESHDDECLDDVTLPPGGRPRQIAAVQSGPDPCYIDRYGRDLRIDLLRGFFVVAMIVDHVRGPSPLYLLTGGNRFYTSAAEGFILTSGLVAGLVYRRLIERNGMGPAMLKVLQRAGILFLLTVGLTLLSLPVSEILDLPWAQGIDLSNPIRVVVSILTLHQTYYLVDVMLLYTILFIIAPLTFVFLERGLSWVVLAVSWLLWGVYQFFPEYASLPWPIAGNYLFNFSAWQMLFFAGLVIGYRQERIPLLSQRWTRALLILTGIGVTALVVIYFIVDPPTAAMPPDLTVSAAAFHDVRLWIQDYLFAKVDLRIGRLIASTLVFNFMFLAATVFWGRIQRRIGWLLLPLGQHALYGYTAHVILVAVIAIAVAPLNLGYPGPQWLNAIIQVASVLLIWALVRWRILAPTPRTQRIWYASPVLIAVLAMLVMRLDPSPAEPGLARVAALAPAPGARVPSRFGTPIPREALAPNAAASRLQVTPTPAPALPWKVIVSADALTRVGEYVAPDLKGSLQERWFYSPELDRDMPYWLYLPPDYGSTSRRYPVLYMLHGLGGHRDEWIVYGLINTADKAILNGDFPPLIIVLPQGDKGYWVNHTGSGPLWGEYVERDLLGHIDSTYRTLRSPRSRAIGGLSMGGWGGLSHAFRRPDLFGVVGAHSVALRPLDDASLSFLGKENELRGKEPVALARSLRGLEQLQIWIDMAEEDPWLEQAALLHGILAGRGIPHIWQVYPGKHEYTYWELHGIDYLRFYATALAQR